MEEILCFLFLVPFCVFLGFLFGKNSLKEEKNEPEEREENLNEECLPLQLRNGFGVTRDKNPTFAEQWVNIMNYSGESQTEEDYEENERDYPEGNME